MSRLRAFAAFWYDFVIGDDWIGAAVVAVALALTALLVHLAVLNPWWLMPAGVIIALGWTLRRATASSPELARGAPRPRCAPARGAAPPRRDGDCRPPS